MRKNFIIAAAILGGTGVALGAFGAHGLQRLTQDEKILHGFQTGVQYQMYHALALLVVAILIEKIQGKFLVWAGRCFITGCILFSGSLYLITFLKLNESGFTKMAGPITPMGGVFFILGWCFLLWAVVRKK